MMHVFQSQYFDEIISLIVSQGVPWLISYFKGNTWSDQQSMILSIVISILVGALSSLASHTLVMHSAMTADDWMKNALIIFGGATAAYKLYFQTSKQNENMEKIGPFNEG